LLVPRNKNKDLADEALLNDFRNKGDLEKLGLLYSRYMHLVYGVCIKYLKDRETAKDEVIAIFEKLASETGDKEILNFKTWLYVITKNHCLMILRSSRYRMEKEAIVIDDPSLFMEKSEEMHPIDDDEQNLNDQRLNDCIERLKDEQRECIRLFYYEDKCYKEIAEKLKMEEKKVKSYIQNGKRNLKICLEGKYVTQ